MQLYHGAAVRQERPCPSSFPKLCCRAQWWISWNTVAECNGHIEDEDAWGWKVQSPRSLTFHRWNRYEDSRPRQILPGQRRESVHFCFSFYSFCNLSTAYLFLQHKEVHPLFNDIAIIGADESFCRNFRHSSMRNIRSWQRCKEKQRRPNLPLNYNFPPIVLQ